MKELALGSPCVPGKLLPAEVVKPSWETHSDLAKKSLSRYCAFHSCLPDIHSCVLFAFCNAKRCSRVKCSWPQCRTKRSAFAGKMKDWKSTFNLGALYCKELPGVPDPKSCLVLRSLHWFARLQGLLTDDIEAVDARHDGAGCLLDRKQSWAWSLHLSRRTRSLAKATDDQALGQRTGSPWKTSIPQFFETSDIRRRVTQDPLVVPSAQKGMIDPSGMMPLRTAPWWHKAAGDVRSKFHQALETDHLQPLLSRLQRK